MQFIILMKKTQWNWINKINQRVQVKMRSFSKDKAKVTWLANYKSVFSDIIVIYYFKFQYKFNYIYIIKKLK